MVNSASQALAEFKSQRLGGLLAGTSSTVSAPSTIGTSLSDSASSRLARSAPKRSTTAFMDQMRKSGQTYHNAEMSRLQKRQQQITGVGGDSGMPSSGGQRVMSGPKGNVLLGDLARNLRLNSSSRAPGSNGSLPYSGVAGLQPGASDAIQRLSAVYQQKFGSPLSITEGWRSYDMQAYYYNLYKAGKGNPAGTPGGSRHGIGLAVDLGGPITNAGSAQHSWLRQNAASFGWYWVGQRWGEPWHWEYLPKR